jgi:hypothetical protein
MRRKDYADQLETLAALHNMSCLVVKEWFEERAAIIEYSSTGITREEAERLAVECVEKELS